MAKKISLKLSWRVERSHGGAGDYWLSVSAEKPGYFSGGRSVMISPPEAITQRELCMSVIHLATRFMTKKSEAAIIKHAYEIRRDTCPQECEKNDIVYCLPCDAFRSDFMKNQQPITT